MLSPKQRSQLEQLLEKCVTKHQIRTQNPAAYEFVRKNPDKISPVGYIDNTPFYDFDEVFTKWAVQAKKTPYRHWTSKELALLVSARADGMWYVSIGKILGRTTASCKVQHYKLMKRLGEETNEQAA